MLYIEKGVFIIKFKFIFIVFIILLISPVKIYANESSVTYSVEAVLNDNQINEDISYFDIGVERKEELELEVIINNSSEEDIIVNIANTTAYTNSNGLITYDGEGTEPHESMEYSFSEISSLESEKVQVPALDQETVKIKVEAPEETFDGIILGGLHFSLDEEYEDAAEGVSIQNRYAYVLGVKIQEKNNDTEVEPELLLNSVKPGIINHRTGLQTEFSNTTPVIINELIFEGSVYEEGAEEPLFTRTVEDFSIAPNSTFNFPVMYDNYRLEAGNYTFKSKVKNDNQEWEFEEEFAVTEETADEANEEAVELVEEEDNTLLMYLVIGLGLLVAVLIAVVIYLLVKRKK